MGNKLNNIGTQKFGRPCFNGFWEIFAAIWKTVSAILEW